MAESADASGPLGGLAKTRVWGSASDNQGRIGGAGWISSTTRWGCGHVYDGTAAGRLVGLDYGWNRYYSSTWGRFTSADPYVMSGGMTTPQGWNRYAYVNGDPANYYDPSGLYLSVPNGPTLSPKFPTDTPDPTLTPGTSPQLGGSQDMEEERSGMGIEAGSDMVGQAIWIAYDGARIIAEKWTWSRECEDLLNQVGTSGIGIQNAAMRVQVFDGTTSQESLYSLFQNKQGGANPSLYPGTVAAAFKPNTHAMADAGGHRVFINPTYFWSLGNGGATMVMLHELVHNATGLTDPDLQRGLGIKEEPDSMGISIKLFSTCFGI